MASKIQREWTACSALVAHAFQWRASLGSNWLTWTFLGLALLVPMVAGIVSGRWAASVGYGGGPLLAIVILLWWMFVVGSFDRQCAPQTRHLAPGTRRRALFTLAGLWLALSVGLGGVLALAWGPSWLMLATGVAAMLAIVAAIAVNPLAALIVPALLFGGAALNGFGVLRLENLFSRPGVPLLLALASCIAGPLIVLRNLGGERAAPPSASGHPAGSVYAWRLKRDTARGRSADLLLHAFGPRAHPLNLVTGSLPGLLFNLIIVVFLLSIVPSAVLRGALVILALLFQFGVAGTMMGAIFASRGEQVLVRLAPAAPACHQLNAMLSAALLRQFLRTWLLINVLLLGALYLLGMGSEALLRLAPVFSMPLLAAAATQRDYTQTIRSKMQQAGELVWFLLSLMLAVAAMMGKLPAAFWTALAACSLAFALAMTWRGRRLMLAAPVAFPAGRMS